MSWDFQENACVEDSACAENVFDIFLPLWSISVNFVKLFREAELKLESNSAYLFVKCGKILHSSRFKKMFRVKFTVL